MSDDHGAAHEPDDPRTPDGSREHAAELARLEERVRIAERRALDAERRLEELTERVGAERLTDEPSDLRTRLARTAAKKRPASDDA